MAKRKTNAQFKQEVFDLVGDEYTFLDSYVNARTKLRVKHNKCGHVYAVIPNNFLKGTRCLYCAVSAKTKTDVQFKQEVFDLVGNEYIFLDSYINTHTRLRVKHNKCGHTYKVEPASFLQGRRCPYCAGLTKKTDNQFKQEVFDLVGNEYTFLDNYVNNMTKIKVRHNKCNSVYKVQPDAFIHGSRCPYCYGNAKPTDAKFKKKIHDLVGNEYVFLDAYVNSKTKLKVKHNKCGHIYKVQPNSFLNGSRCPYCNSPKGELIISKILNSLNINYEAQKTFDDLRDNNLLSYDFFIPSQNILIEYQGRQHYDPVDYFGGVSQFKLQQKHDKMKASYARDNNYTLIAVPYTEDTFSKIKKYLLKHELKLH